MTERLTEEVLQELLDAPSLDAFVDGREFPAETLAGFLGHMLEKKHLKRSRVVRMADLNETFGYQIFTGARNPRATRSCRLPSPWHSPCARRTGRSEPPGRAPSTPNAAAMQSSSFASARGAASRR